MESMECPNCSGKTIEKLVSYRFCYGLAPNTVRLRVVHMAFICQDLKCDTIITDYRGEEAREQAVKEYLNA